MIAKFVMVFNTNLKNDFRGITLLEVFIAVAVLMMAIIPIFHHSSDDAATALETEKIQKADHILQSVKEELVAMPFKKFNVATEGADEDDYGPYELPSGFFPVTYNEVLELQKKYRDFQIVGTWSYLIRNEKVDRSMVQVDMMVYWDRPKAPPIKRTKSMLIVKP